MRYLITGGAGFIGSHLTDALIARGEQVLVLDDLSTGRRENLAHLRDSGDLELAEGSVLDERLVDDLVRRADAVVHLAAAVGVDLILREPIRSLTTNIRGSETVLAAADRHERLVLLASTSEIYGKNGDGPFREDSDRCLGPPTVMRWAYSTSKAVDEALAHAYGTERGLATVVVRLFNTVGPRQVGTYGMVLPRFADAAVRGEPLTVFGNGLQTRCFLHVRDAVRAVLNLLDEPRAMGEVFNVGSSEEVSIVGLARRVVAAAGSASPVRIVPYAEGYEAGFEDMKRRVPDTSKIRRLVGWKPRFTLDEVIAEVVDEARSGRHGDVSSGRCSGAPHLRLAETGTTP